MSSSEEPKERAFLDFYTTHNIIPVHQDISDLQNHAFRRNYLYRTLGMAPALLKGKRVLEFGPGTGDNAVATSLYGLAAYDFVDGNPSSVRELQKRIDSGQITAGTTKITEANIFDYRSDEKYEVVIVEGVIPGQDKPKEFLSQTAASCELGGIVIITTVSYTSLLAEICRNVFRPAIISEKDSFEQQVKVASDVFRDHLSTFGVVTRPIEVWVQDNILHNWPISHNRVFSLWDALDVFEGKFQFYGSSPRYVVDDRWYKAVNSKAADFNAIARDQYHNFSALLLDYRNRLETVQQSRLGKSWAVDLEQLSKDAYDAQVKICREHSYDNLEAFLAVLQKLGGILPPEMSQTKDAITDFSQGIREVAGGKINHKFGAFRSWWGRGQQYASFVREV